MAQSAFIRKVNPWHQRLADWLILNGTTKGWNERASKEFNVTQAWISTVVHSDAFQDYYQELNGQHSQALLHSVREKALGAADQAISEIQKRLDEKGADLPYESLLQTADLMMKRTGHGDGPAQPANVQVNIGLVTREELEHHRARLRSGPKALELKVSPATGDGDA